MRLTPVLGVRSLVAKLHPPLLKTPRESQQLLSVLNSSFKRQLDQAHPPVNPVEAPAFEPFHANDTVFANPSANAANDHLLSILHHPLLETKDADRTRPQSASARAVRLLDSATVEGRVTPALLEQCIRIYHQNGKRPSGLPEGQRLGNKITAWFNTADAATKESFLTGQLMVHVVPLMYSEAQEQVVWEWLRVMYEGDFGGWNDKTAYDPKSLAWREKEANLVRLMVRESVRRGNLPGAIQEYAQAWYYMTESGRLPRESHRLKPNASTSSMSRTSAMIVHMIISRRHNHGVPSLLYDLITRLDQHWCWPKSYQQVFLPIYHPSRPSAEDLLLCLRSGDFPQHNAHALRERANLGRPKLATVAMIDAAQLLLDQGQPLKAQYVLDEIEKHFPDYVSERKLQDNESRIQAAREEVAARPAELSFG